MRVTLALWKRILALSACSFLVASCAASEAPESPQDTTSEAPTETEDAAAGELIPVK
ncbi:MAG: hypothetical protein F6K42_11245, partial [Leptolyngbya sp. SIO1D8]|nr:hypothetical protein [Leptolyngbya sp. SIO1D8]